MLDVWYKKISLRLPWYATYRHTAKIMFSEEISKTFQLLATLQNFLSTFYDKFKSITQNNDIISSFGSICLLLVVVIDEIRKFGKKTFYGPQNMVCHLGAHH